MTSSDAWQPRDRVVPFSSFEPLVGEFRNSLTKIGIAISPGGALDKLCDLTVRLARRMLSQSEQESPEALEGIAGFITFAAKVVEVSAHTDFAQLTDHLKLLESGKIKINSPDTDHKKEGPKLFELLMALSAFHIGSNIKLDDPAGGSQGTNPDILADIDKQRWGIACKLLYGSIGLTVKRATEKGIDQIERCAATTGVVVLSLNNLLDHTAIRGDITQGWPGIDKPLQLMRDTVELKKKQLKAEFSDVELNGLFAGKKALPVILLYTHAMTVVKSAVDSRPIPTLLRFLSQIPFGDTSAGIITLTRLNLSLQDQPDMAQS